MNHDHTEHAVDIHAGPSLGTYVAVYVALLVLMALTIFAAYQPLGYWNVPIALSIAFTKTILVALYFMHLRYAPRLTWVVAAGALVWLAILLSVYGDYYTRSWHPNPFDATRPAVPID
jgi:cytochrome c oxidase subunit 4